MPFERLFSPLTLKGVTIRNRIASTGHNTRLAWANVANEALAAYHAERAKGGAGLILTEGAVVHETGRHLSIANDSDIKGFRLVADAVHPHGAKVFGQMFHPGREMSIAFDGTKPITHAPSAIPNERFHAMPRAMSKRMIREFVASYAAGARRYREAGMDGCEVLASQGYGIGQFLNEQSNRRQDRYGGSFENRLRFAVEIARAVRASVGDDFPIGIRISGDEMNPMGMKLPEVVAICAALDAKNCFDYYNITPVLNFTGGEGAAPGAVAAGDLIIDHEGFLVGTTAGGGISAAATSTTPIVVGAGTVFKYNIGNGEYFTPVVFAPDGNSAFYFGYSPATGVIELSDGAGYAYYGIASQGGRAAQGSVFKFGTPTNREPLGIPPPFDDGTGGGAITLWLLAALMLLGMWQLATRRRHR